MAGIMRLGWRNLGRNRRRTLSTAAALAFGISLCVASYGLVDGLNAELLDALTRLDLGHGQVHQADYAKRRKLERTIADPGPIMAAAAATDGVLGVAPRVYAFGLLSAGNQSSGVQLVGVDPTAEPTVTTLHEKVTRGEYLDAESTPWPKGRALTEAERTADQALTEAAEAEVLGELDALESLDSAPAPTSPSAAPTSPSPAPTSPSPVDAERTQRLARALAPPPDRPPRVLLGTNLGRVLGVDVGDALYLTAQTVDGSAESVFLEVAGIFETGTQQYDRTRLYLHIADLDRLVHLDGRPHEIALRTSSPQDAPAVLAQLQTRLDRPDVTVRPWNAIRPDIEQMLMLNSASTGLMVFIIFIVATLGVVNTMLMAVFERTRELGVLKAIGMSGKRIVALIVSETLLLVLASSVVGTVLGLGMDLYMVHHGIDLRWLSEGISFGGLGIDPVLHGAITTEGLLMPTVILSFTCLIASIYPALRAARMQPAVGMRET